MDRNGESADGVNTADVVGYLKVAASASYTPEVSEVGWVVVQAVHGQEEDSMDRRECIVVL